MKWLRTMMVMTMLAAWLPALNHCRLEQLPALQFLSCCAHEDAAPHQDNDCDTDNCQTVEEAAFKVETFAVTVPAPVLLPMVFDLPSFVELTTPQTASRIRLDALPPELPQRWQFVERAAPSPRAPSLLS